MALAQSLPASRLSIAEYDQLEQAALRTASYPVIRAFSPTHFHLNGFPTRVRDEAELRRYADAMGELNSRSAIWERKFSNYEAGIILLVAKRVAAITNIDPFTSLFGPISMWRGIEQIAKDRNLKILDVGAGLGYLDMYLSLAGHRVWAVEVTQALYLWQSLLFEGSNIEQVPWWDYAQWYEYADLRFDLVVCDAALGEMDSWAARYTMALAAKFNAPLVYRNVGEPRTSTEAGILAHARSIGLDMRKIIDPPLLGPALNKAKDFYHPTNLPPSYAFMDFIGIGR